MRKLIFLFLLLPPVSAPADTAQEVRCREIGFARSVEEGDRARFESFIDTDARFVGATVNRGVEAISGAWNVFFEPEGPGIKWRPQFVEVLETGDLALTRGPYRVTTRDEAGDPVEYWGTFNSVWRRQADGQWKVVFDAGSEGNEHPADEVKALLDQPDTCMEAPNP